MSKQRNGRLLKIHSRVSRAVLEQVRESRE